MIEKFIHDLCNLLNIECPSISLDTSNFPSDTMMAQCSPDGSTIYLRKFDRPNPDQLFSIAHELRHIWQIKTNKELFFSSYKPVNDLSIEEYNLQIAEVDANAFAGIVMVDIFRLKPTFKDVPESVRNKVYDRMKYIADNELI